MSLAEKYDTEKKWEEPCVTCGKPVTMCAARWEIIGAYHDGCFGWPVCACKVSHEGDCKPGSETIFGTKVPGEATEEEQGK